MLVREFDIIVFDLPNLVGALLGPMLVSILSALYNLHSQLLNEKPAATGTDSKPGSTSVSRMNTQEGESSASAEPLMPVLKE